MRQERLFLLSPILFIIMLLFSTFITKGDNGIWYIAIYDTISVIHIIPILFLYFIAFPKLAQKTPHELLVFKTHWLQSISVMLGLLGSSLALLFSVESLIGELYTEGGFELNVLTTLSLSIAVSTIATVYGLFFAFCFFLISIFIKSDSGSEDKLTFYDYKKIRYKNIISLFWIFLLLTFTISLSLIGAGTNLSDLINHHYSVFAFPLLIILVIILYRDKSLKNIFNNYFGDYYDDEKLESQLKFILTLKKFIMGVVFILFIMLPIWTMYGLSAAFMPNGWQPNAYAIFWGFSNISTIFALGIFLVIMLSVIEAKYIQRYYMINNKLRYDNYFIYKYIGIPTFIWYLYLIVFWILTMVLI